MGKKSLKVKIFLNLFGTYKEVRNVTELYITIIIMASIHKVYPIKVISLLKNVAISESISPSII